MIICDCCGAYWDDTHYSDKDIQEEGSLHFHPVQKKTTFVQYEGYPKAKVVLTLCEDCHPDSPHYKQERHKQSTPCNFFSA